MHPIQSYNTFKNQLLHVNNNDVIIRQECNTPITRYTIIIIKDKTKTCHTDYRLTHINRGHQI